MGKSEKKRANERKKPGKTNRREPGTGYMYVGSLAGVTYPRYTVLMSPKKGETAVYCCDPALSVLVMSVSRNVFHVVSALRSIVCLYTFFWLIRSLVDPTLAAFIVCGPLQYLVSL